MDKPGVQNNNELGPVGKFFGVLWLICLTMLSIWAAVGSMSAHVVQIQFSNLLESGAIPNPLIPAYYQALSLINVSDIEAKFPCVRKNKLFVDIINHCIIDFDSEEYPKAEA